MTDTKISDLEHIRMRPTAYIPSLDSDGCVFQAKMIIDNAIESLSLQPAKSNKIVITFFVDEERETYQLMVRDTGNGMPSSLLVPLFTRINTTGKPNERLDQFGVGAKVAAALSRHFRVISRRPEDVSTLYLHNGEFIETRTRREASEVTGVTVIYEPDPTLLTGVKEFFPDGWFRLVELVLKDERAANIELKFRTRRFGLPQDIWQKSAFDTEEILPSIPSIHQVWRPSKLD